MLIEIICQDKPNSLNCLNKMILNLWQFYDYTGQHYDNKMLIGLC